MAGFQKMVAFSEEEDWSNWRGGKAAIQENISHSRRVWASPRDFGYDTEEQGDGASQTSIIIEMSQRSSERKVTVERLFHELETVFRFTLFWI